MSSTRHTPPWLHLLLIVLALIWLGIHVSSLTHYVPVTCDEAWYASTSAQFLEGGNFGMPLMSDLFNLDESHSGFGRLYLLMLSAVFAVGRVGVVQGRILSLLGAVALTASTYSAGNRLFNQRVGIVSAILVAFAWDVYARSHLIRPEIWLAASVPMLLVLYWWFRDKPTFIRGLVFGFIGTIPISLHQNGILFLLGFGVLCLIDFVFRERKLAALIGAGTGVIIGMIAWLAVHFLPDAEASYGQWVSIGQSPVGANAAALIADMGNWLIAQYGRAYSVLTPIQAIYFIVGIALLIWYRNTPKIYLLLLTVISMIAFTFLKIGKQPPTSVLWIPLFVLLLVVQLDDRYTNYSNRFQISPILGLMILVSPLLLVYIAGNGWLAYKFRTINYEQEVLHATNSIEPDSYLVADSRWWFGLRDRQADFLDDNYFLHLWDISGVPMTEEALSDSFQEFGVDYVILDEAWGCAISPSASFSQYAEFVQSHCALVDTVNVQTTYNTVENGIYQCAD